MTRQVSPLAIGALALMALLLAAVWLAPGAPGGWRQWQAPAPQAPNLDDLTAAALRFNPAATAVYPAVLQRPLMVASRRPQAPASAPAGPAEPPPTAIEQVRLQGIVAGPTLTGVFLEEGGQSRFVRRGEKVGDWTLDAIRGRDIVFQRGAQQRTIELLPTPADSAKAGAKPPPAAQRTPGPAATQPAHPNAAQPVRPAAPPAPPARLPAAAPQTVPTPAPAPAAGPGSSSRGGFGGGGQAKRPAADATPR